MNKKSLGALLLSAALLIGGTASTFAYFTNTAETTTVSFTTGNVKVRFLADQETPWRLDYSANSNKNNEFNITDPANATKVAPGDEFVKFFKLENNGSLDAKVRLSLANMDPSADKVNSYAGYGTTWKVYKVNDDNTRGAEVQITSYPEYALLDATTHEQLWVGVFVQLKADMNNDYNTLTKNNDNFDKTFKFNLKAEATQWNNLGWDQAGN
jgi:predicted ribosomally synthesized peptide with SipW-like signal peptide